MADEKNPIVTAVENAKEDRPDFTGSYAPLADLAEYTSLGKQLGDRNVLGDSAVGILDTLQSIGNLALSPLDEFNLEDAGENSQFLDEFRSPAYLAEKRLQALASNPNAGFIEGAGEGLENVFSGDNLVPDALAQAPYLLMGPAGRLAGVARAEKAAGILGKMAKYSFGTNDAALINRIAVMSGALEGSGAYSQTFARAKEEGLSDEEAREEARQAAGVSTVLGTVLGRLTPGFELSPTGKFGRNLTSHLSAVGAEAIVEEGGLAVGQTVFDNILAGNNPMEGVGLAFGQAAGVSGAFSGALRSPRATLEAARAVGAGVRGALSVLGKDATTPEDAAVDAADAANPPTAPVTPIVDAVDEAVAERQAIQAVEAEADARINAQEAAAEREAIQSVENEDERVSSTQTTQVPSSEGTGTGIDIEQAAGLEAEEAPTKVDTNSSSAMIRAVLVNAANDATIESTSGKEQAAALSRKEELAPIVKEAEGLVERLPDDRVAAVAAEAAKGNVEAQRVVEAVRRVDASKLPESAIPEKQKPIVRKIKELKDLQLDSTTNDILVQGFKGSQDSRGVRGYLQGLYNLKTLGVKTASPTASEFTRFVNHLTARADAFSRALADNPGVNNIPVAGTKTRSKTGGLSDTPFEIHRNSKNSMKTVERVIEDAAKAKEALDLARKTYPELFEKETAVVAPVRSAGTSQNVPTPAAPVAAAIPQAQAPAAPIVEVPSAPAAPAVTQATATEASELSLVDDNAPARSRVDVTEAGPVEAGLFPEQFRLPESTRREDERGLIDVNEQGDRWKITNTFTADTARGTGAGTERLVATAQRAAAAGKPLDSDASVHPHALALYLRAISKGLITAEFDEADVKAAIANNTPLRRESGVFRNIRPVSREYAKFGTTNHFTAAFTPNGTNLGAESIESLVARMKQGTDADKRAAEHIEKYLTPMRNAINTYVKRVLNGPVSKKNSMKLKDALSLKDSPIPDYPDHIWVNLLQKTADGYQLNPSVVDSAVIATLIQLTRGAFQRQVFADEDSNSDGTYYQWLTNVGGDAMRILGMTADFSESTTLTDGIPKSLASTILGVLEKEGDITVDTAVINDKTFKNITMSPALVSAMRTMPAFGEVMRKWMGDAEDDTISYGTAPTKIKGTVRNSRTVISDEQRTAIGNRQKVVHYRNMGFHNVLSALGLARYSQLITGFSEVSDDKHLNEVSKSLTIGITGELNAVDQYNAGIEHHAAESGTNPDELPMHFSYEILSNGRSYSGYSPQAKKTLREFLSVGRSVLDLTNPQHLLALKLGIAQALNIKTDVNSHEEIAAKFDQIDEATKDRALAVHLASQGKLSGEELMGILNRDAVYEPKELHGLMTLGKYLANSKQMVFETQLTFEIDGKTSGPFNAELLYGLHTMNQQTTVNLEQGGLFQGVEGETLATQRDNLRIKYGSADLYERVARGAIILKDPVLVLAGFVTEQNEVTRAAAKEAVTPLVYGSRTSSLSRVFTDRLRNGLAEQLRLAIKHGNPKMAAIIRGHLSDEANLVRLGAELAEGLDASYSNEKPQVTRTNRLMVAVTTLHAGVRKTIFDAKVKELLDKKHADGSLPKQFDLSRADYDKIMKTLPRTQVEVPGMGTIVVGESANTGRASSAVAGAGKVNSVQVSKPEVVMPGVAILANSTIGAGDAAMGNHLFQNQEQVLDVYDGIEMSLDQINAMGTKLNDAVWSSASDSLLDSYIPLIEWLEQNVDQLYNEHTAKTLETLRKEYRVSSNKALLNELKKDVVEISAGIKAGRAELASKPNSLNQMAGGGVPYTTPVSTDPRTEATLGNDVREGWDNKVEATFDANNGVLTREGVINLLDNHKWASPIHRAVWNAIRNSLPQSLFVGLAKNEAEWNKLNDASANGIQYGDVRGTSYYNTGVIALATASPTTLLHELVHQMISGNLTAYFININTVPVEMRQPINALHQLLGRFMTLKGDALTAQVQGLVRSLEAKGDTAAAIDEMVAHVLTNETVINEIQPSFFQRVVDRMSQLLQLLLGRAATKPFIDELFAQFTKLARGPRMNVNTSVRTSPILNKTQAAFAAIAQRVANGTIKAVPKVKDSGLDQIQAVLNLTPDQQRAFKRTWMLLRMGPRSGMLEKFANTVLAKHPNAPTLFNGNIDAVAAVMALTAADDTFRVQADAIWITSQATKTLSDSLVDQALHGSATENSIQLLSEALDVMREEGEYNLSFLGTATQRLDRIGNEWMETIGDIANTASQSSPKGTQTILAGIAALTTENGAEAFGRTLFKLVNEFTSQRWLQDLTAAVVGSQDDTNEVYRQVNSMKSMIAQTRSLFTITLPAQLKTLFPEGFDGWNHLFSHFGRVDAGVLGTAAGQMYSDDAARAKAIKALESKVKNWYDAKNLGHYLAHGMPMPGSQQPLLRNARAVADNLNGNKKKAADSLVTDADQLITLYAIEALSVTDRARIAGYFTKHTDAMNNLVGMLHKVAEEESKQYEDEYRYAYWKGALPLSTDPRTSIVVAGSVKGAQLEALGYRKHSRYKSSADDPANDLHYYVRNNAPPPVFSQGVISTVQQTSQGINYTTASTISPEVGTIITDPRLITYIQRHQGRNSQLVPIFNFDGDIVGYERLLDRKLVQSMTNSNNTLLHIAIGHKLGRILEERLANRFNKEAIGILLRQWEDGKGKGEEAQYEDVTSTTDKQIARAWEVVPAATKKALQDAFQGPVMIRRDLIANTLGYHKAGVLDIYTGNASMSEETRRGLFGLAQTIFLGSNGAKYLFIAEQAIKEGVATAKDWIIVRSISVAVSNALASMNLVIANGVPIKELFASYREGIRDVRTYTRLQKEIIELTVKMSGSTGAEAEKLRTIQRAKYESIRKLAIYPLIEAGELSDLPEGLEDTPQHSYLGDFGGWLNNHLRQLHPKAPAVLGNAFIAKDTTFHDAMSKVIQAGDFLGKWAVYKHMVKSGKSVEVARDTVRDEFISYGTNPGRFRGAMEDFGLVWWSQFTIRAQKVLLRRFRKNPFSFFMANVYGGLTGADSPGDAALPERHWDSGTGLDNVLNAPSAHIWSKIF